MLIEWPFLGEISYLGALFPYFRCKILYEGPLSSNLPIIQCKINYSGC